ncbi:MAG: iron ABC transporter permease [Treponema sp.]
MRKLSFDVKWVCILTIVLFLIIFEVLPLFYLVIKAFFPEGSFSLSAFQRVYGYDMNRTAVFNTLITAGWTTVFGVLIAFPLAFLVGRTNMYGKRFFRTLFVISYMVPPYVGAMAWARLLNPNAGVINKLLQTVFHLSESPFNIYSMGGVIWVLTCFYYPYAFITISRAMEKMDPSLEEAARISGAGPLHILRTITIPMMLPSIIAAALLVFIAAASAFGIPAIIGAPGYVYTATTRIIDFVHLGTEQGLTDATTLAVFLMVIANIVLYCSTFLLKGKQYVTMSGKSTRPTIVDLGKWRIPLTCFAVLFAVIVIIIPFASVMATSVTVNMGKPLSFANMSLKAWSKVFHRASILQSMKNSMISAFAAASFGMIISCTMAYLLERTRVKGRRIPDFLITVGSGTPSVVIALALIITMSGKFGINLYNTLSIMIIAYMIKYMLMGMRPVVSAMGQVHNSLEEAAQISGAGWLRMLKDISIPLIGASVVAGFFLIFMPSFYELTMSNLLYSAKTKTIGYDLYYYQTTDSLQVASALATAILFFVIILNIILNKLTKGKISI